MNPEKEEDLAEDIHKLKTDRLKPSMVVYTFNPSTWDMEAEAGRFVSKKEKGGLGMSQVKGCKYRMRSSLTT